MILLVTSAAAADGPSLWVRELGAVTLRPSGVLVDVAAEARAPILRFGGAVFNDTFVGAGARVAASPAFADTALRLSVQPIDVLPITVEAVRTWYWESPFGLVPMDSVADTTQRARRPLYEADADFAGHAWQLSVSPTLQARVGPIVAFSNVTGTFIQVRPVSPDAPWVYEPFRGLVVAYDDFLVEHTSAVLWEPADGEDRALVRVGPVMRGKSSRETPDATLTLGGLLQWRPGKRESAPALTALVSAYLVDPDFEGPIPSVVLLLTSASEHPL